jgi:hypothetical protein
MWQAQAFVEELWTLLVDAQSNPRSVNGWMIVMVVVMVVVMGIFMCMSIL